MNDNDIKLLQLIQEVKKGNKDVYDEISNLIIDEVYNLVSFVYKKEETRKKLARHVVVHILRSMDEFDSETMDIHMWIARFTTIEIYNVYSKQNGNIFSKTYNNLSYEYNSIEEDALFENCAAEYNCAFIDIAELNKINGKLSSLTKAQKIIYEMFCYECFSIDEIEDVLEVDSTYIIDAIAGMKEQLCVYSSQESLDSADSINRIDNDIAISEEEAYELNNIYNNHSKSNRSYYTLFSKKISKKSLISAASCAAVILLAIIVVVVVSIRDKNSASNVANYGKMSTKSTTSKTQNTTAAATANTKKDDESTTQTEEETEPPSTKSNSGNNQRPTTGNSTYVKPSSNVPNNPTQKTTVSKPDEPTQSPDDKPDNTTNPDGKPDDTTNPDNNPDDTTNPDDKPDDTTNSDNNPDDTTNPDDKPDDTTNPDNNPDDTTNPSDESNGTQKPDGSSDKNSNEGDLTQNN